MSKENQVDDHSCEICHAATDIQCSKCKKYICNLHAWTKGRGKDQMFFCSCALKPPTRKWDDTSVVRKGEGYFFEKDERSKEEILKEYWNIAIPLMAQVKADADRFRKDADEVQKMVQQMKEDGKIPKD